MKKSKIKLLLPSTPTSTQLLSPTSRAGNDYLNFWPEIEKKPKAKQVAVQTLDETQTTQKPKSRPFVLKSHSLTDYDGLNEFFKRIETQKSNKSTPLVFFIFLTLLIV